HVLRFVTQAPPSAAAFQALETDVARDAVEPGDVMIRIGERRKQTECPRESLLHYVACVGAIADQIERETMNGPCMSLVKRAFSGGIAIARALDQTRRRKAPRLGRRRPKQRVAERRPSRHGGKWAL